METSTRIIKQHVLNTSSAIDYSKSSAQTGIEKLGIKYNFTNLNHHEIMAIFEKARIKKGLNKAKLSLQAGYGDSAYNQIARGSRLSSKSFDAFCKVLKVLHYDNSTQGKIEFTPVSVQDMIAHLKSLGYKIQKPITTYEEI